MEEIKNWAFSGCAAMVCGAIMNMLLPEGSLQKIYKCVICVFLLCVVVAPIAEIKLPDLKNLHTLNSIEPMSETKFNEISAEIIEEQIAADTSKLLLDEGAVFGDIYVKINISENGGIDINKFVLTLDKNCDFGVIKEKVKQKIGAEPEIIVSGENINGNSE